MRRILTIQDISCVGKCSLTVALPIISAFGVETAVLPTAVLSTHTQFKGFTFKDLTDQIVPIKNHWLDQMITFDGLYSGYLGSFEQLKLVGELFDEFKTKDNIILIDPVMADNGKLYAGFTKEFALSMAKLCEKADVIVPNLTEASFMLDKPYVEKGYSEDYIKQTLKELTGLGAKIAVLTGVSFQDDKLGVYGYNSQTHEYFSYFTEKIPVSFHGTGDIYASSLLGALTRGYPLDKALKIATDYTLECIKITAGNPDHNWYGVEFEKAIPFLIETLKNN